MRRFLQQLLRSGLLVITMIVGCDPIAPLYGIMPAYGVTPPSENPDPSLQLVDLSYQPASPVADAAELTITVTANKASQAADGVLVDIGENNNQIDFAIRGQLRAYLVDTGMAPDEAAGDGVFTGLLRFANSQPIVWPSIALIAGSLIAVALFSHVRRHALQVMGEGTQDAIMPLINTAAVIGFGGVVTHTAGFAQFTSAMLESGLPPLVSMFMSVSIVSAITGSASGGLQIFMQTLAPTYLEMGVDAEVLHRVSTMASGGFDSLPHCGAIVAMLTITGLTHREAYRDVGIITVVIPVLATLAVMAAAALLA